LIICLNQFGCKDFEKNVERCTLNVIEKECYCHMYQISPQYVGKIGETKTYQLEYCDKLVGFQLDDWNDVYEVFIRNKNPTE